MPEDLWVMYLLRYTTLIREKNSFPTMRLIGETVKTFTFALLIKMENTLFYPKVL